MQRIQKEGALFNFYPTPFYILVDIEWCDKNALFASICLSPHPVWLLQIAELWTRWTLYLQCQQHLLKPWLQYIRKNVLTSHSKKMPWVEINLAKNRKERCPFQLLSNSFLYPCRYWMVWQKCLICLYLPIPSPSLAPPNSWVMN